MARCAVSPKQADVTVLGLVAGGTIEQPFFGRELRVFEVSAAALFPEPLFELFRLIRSRRRPRPRISFH